MRRYSIGIAKTLFIFVVSAATANAQSAKEPAETQVATASSMQGFGVYPPLPKPEPFTETVHGVVVSDPYRWMERPERRAEVVNWVNASSTQTTTALAKLPGRVPLLKALEDASRSSVAYGSVRLAGDRMFFLELAPEVNQPVLKVRENGHDRLLLDPMAGAPPGTHLSIDNYTPSPTGKLVAVNLAEGGGEIGTTRFYDVGSGKPLNDSLAPIWGGDVVNWIDETTVTYLRMSEGGSKQQMENNTAYLHHLGQPVRDDIAVLGSKVGAGFPVKAEEVPFVVTYWGSAWALGIADTARADRRLAYASVHSLMAGKPHWTMLAEYSDQVRDFSVQGDTLFFLTTARDPNGEVRSIELGSGALATSKHVLGSDGSVLQGLYVTTQGIFVTTMVPDASSHMLFVARGTTRAVDVGMPVVGSINDVSVRTDRTGLSLMVSGILSDQTHYRVEAAKLVPLGLASETLPSTAHMVVKQEVATSADGTEVPLTITAPKESVRPRPTLLQTYASYGYSGQPRYSTSTVVWVTRGGVMAECHARGGGEKGRAWHEAGRAANKVNAMADVIACGERLVQLGYTTPKLLGLTSSSAGGLLVTPVGLKRPDLFSAIVTQVGVVNPTRLAYATNGSNQFAEMGDPSTEEGFRALAVQDSTLLLPDSKGGTSQLFTVGLNDHRVEPWMSAKLVAMMRAKWGDDHLVLIRSDVDAGHGAGSSRDQWIDERADVFAFLLNRFDQPGFVLVQ